LACTVVFGFRCAADRTVAAGNIKNSCVEASGQCFDEICHVAVLTVWKVRWKLFSGSIPNAVDGTANCHPFLSCRTFCGMDAWISLSW